MAVNLFIIFIIQFYILFILNKLAYKFDFLDYPNKRKIHSKPTPYLGGLSLSVTYFFVIYLLNNEFLFFKSILLCAILISAVGLIDDKVDMNPVSKLLLQTIPVIILISQGLYLTDIGEYQLFGKINLGYYGKIFTFLSCLLIINAFNYVDGVDGLLPSLFINIFSSFLFVCYMMDKIYISQILIYLTFPVLIFLFFNIALFNLPKFFLGDSGSTLLGFLTGFIMIYLYSELFIEPSILIWPVAIIIYDFLSTNIFRIIKKKKIFKSGNDHIHYQILNKYNLSKLGINVTINLINCLTTFFGFMIYYLLGPTFSLLSFILCFFIYSLIKYYLID